MGISTSLASKLQFDGYLIAERIIKGFDKDRSKEVKQVSVLLETRSQDKIKIGIHVWFTDGSDFLSSHYLQLVEEEWRPYLNIRGAVAEFQYSESFKTSSYVASEERPDVFCKKEPGIDEHPHLPRKFSL